MRNTISILSALGVALFALAPGAFGARPGNDARGLSGPAPGAQLHLIILHTNDLHGQVLPRPAFWVGKPNPPNAGGIGRIAGYVNRVRREAADAGDELLVLDAGDWSQGSPEGALGQGRDFMRALVWIGYDAMCLGNHEFDHGIDALVDNLAAVPLPALVANVRDAQGGAIGAVPSYRIFERGGLRVAVVGLLSPDTPGITHPTARTWRFGDPAVALRTAREELGDRADWVLPLTHLGLTADRELARAHPDLDLIVGGHSHTVLPKGQLQGSTRIVQAGSKASAIGRVDVWFDLEKKQVVKLEARIVDLFREPEARDRNERLQAECQAMLERGSEVLDTPIGSLAAPMSRAQGALQSSPSGNLISDAMRAATGADVALQNRGGIRADLQGGVVTRRDVFSVLPFSNRLVVLNLSGRELEACLRRAVEGRGRRGPEISGMTLELRRVAGAVELARVTVAGRTLDPGARYSLATNSFLASGGDGYEDLVDAERQGETSTLLREVLEGVFSGGEPVTPPAENRYLFVD
ncbi:MAG: 5'-nucleotidase/UDP-sugar diphosphatase [Chlamydiales bacterium]|jgi:5'-nucleotidase/UDP-sugar diphosphatase